jgi:2,4-dienoyl-CoA reductase-like NADH-dependent reductase (Old Yellow Enzyme family)
LSNDVLFQPFSYKSLHMPNRVVMAPMTRGKSPDGTPTEDVAQYYRRRAEGEVGLIVTEGTGVGRQASLNDPNYPHFYGDAALAQWKRVVDEVHAAGGLIAPQLWHMGLVRTRHPTWTIPGGVYDSPSGYTRPDNKIDEGMSDEDVADAVAAFGRAAGDAKRLGFDALELHGAHGYLIDQFFWGELNKRGDSWGGDGIVQRNKFATEILKAVRAAVGPDFVVIIRVSQWKQHDYTARLAHTQAEMETWLGGLVDAGADIIHCSQRRIWEPEFEGSDLNFAGWAKKLTGAPTIAVGSVGLAGLFTDSFKGEGAKSAPLNQVTEMMDRGDFDLVAVGRAILQDPNWVKKVHEGRVDEISDFDDGGADLAALPVVPEAAHRPSGTQVVTL